MKALHVLTLAAATLLTAGCGASSVSQGLANSIATAQAPLSMTTGDKIIGVYQNCAGHTDGDAWEVALGNEQSSTLWVVSRDRNCQLWLSQLQRGNNEVFVLKNPVSSTVEYPILIQPKFRPDLVALAVRSSGGVQGALVNAAGTGLDFASSTFTIELRSGSAAELGEISVTATGP